MKTEKEIFPNKFRGQKQIKFINILNEKDESNYHIYFNDNTIEILRTFFISEDKVLKIKIILDYKFKSFHHLYEKCSANEKINFILFYRIDIMDICYMFSIGSKLKEFISKYIKSLIFFF